MRFYVSIDRIGDFLKTKNDMKGVCYNVKIFCGTDLWSDGWCSQEILAAIQIKSPPRTGALVNCIPTNSPNTIRSLASLSISPHQTPWSHTSPEINTKPWRSRAHTAQTKTQPHWAHFTIRCRYKSTLLIVKIRGQLPLAAAARHHAWFNPQQRTFSMRQASRLHPTSQLLGGKL